MVNFAVIPGEIMLAFIRLMPLLVIFPVPGIDRLPVFVRVFFCLAMAVMLAGQIPAAGPADIGNYLTQFVLGLALALGVHSCFAGLHIGGHLVDTQAGTNAASIFNPAQSGSGIFVEFLMLATAVTVLLSDTVIILLGQTLALSPQAGLALLQEENFFPFLDLLGRNMIAGFLITFPVIAGLWLMDVLAAFSSRLLPQSNIYFLFLPVKTLFTTFLFIAYAGLLLMTANRIVADALVA